MAIAPLAERLRPELLDQYIGQQHLVGPGKVLRVMAEQHRIVSMILWGPPGVGKTTLANILAKAAGLPFVAISAVASGVKEIKEVIQLGEKSGRIVLFIDEIHRFNKAQQDALLGAVEKGTVTLVGATTENPSFEVISALLSRCQVYVLEPLSKAELISMAEHAITTDTVLQQHQVTMQEHRALLQFSGGDGRKLLNLMELLAEVHTDGPLVITDELVEQVVQEKMSVYDKSGEQHYDIISAFIKSIRGSDPNAAVYYLARMIEGGEDPKFIARRMLILASEDIGNANPNALLLATSCFQAVTMLGYPECGLTLAQTAIFLANSAKSNSSYMALQNAKKLVQQHVDLPVPMALRNAPTKLMKELNYGSGYQYAHDHPGNFAAMEFLPDAISGKKLYHPGQNAREEESRKFLRTLWKEKYGY